MDNVISQIRGVIGVTGALIYHRKLEQSKAVFPASFEETTLDQLKHKFFEMCQSVNADSSMRVKLNTGWLIMKFTENFGFMVLAKEDLNVATLNLVLKSITVSLEHSKNPLYPTGPVVFTEDSLQTLLKAVNLITEHFSNTTSRFQIADRLRQCKTKLMDQYPDLKKFNVDHNARVDLLHGMDIEINASLGEAIAVWLAEFKMMLTTQSGNIEFDLNRITAELHTELDQIRFYDTFQKHAQ